ncbi:acetate/propionate family kinase [Pseudobacteroides cellulosolvens]|uniref:Acetate kinase n=1 Tax=Pseudobacteroides cellulosolvens ATCC 35603 = DSM 2933 TaxID=398512 RepID=A0A0L6JI09_9FIRM|nr:acetate kinase [Pseudobacteroides cellulosolvens]KNY25117.1 Acetate kinase [Pseudobacteroides cellulosolvens ATCC 35603 = DSM 2933]
MKILVINTGSSSLKYQLIDTMNEAVLAKGNCDRIGIENSFIKHTKMGSDAVVIEKDMANHKVAIQQVLNVLTDKDIGVISNMSEIAAVGHRVVHGGERFHDSVIIDDEVMKALRECIELAPLHNPPNIIGIEACKEVMPNTPMVAVFDTAFHQTMPKHAYLYALPYEIYEKYGVRKYGFHGTSHKYVANRAAEILGKSIEDLNIITCHLGNGASICAVRKGKSVETSMGFTPLAGLAMGTRCGTIDPAVISYLMDKEKMSVKDINDYLNKKSGVLGISGVSSDFRDIEAAADEGNERASLAIEIFCYRVKKYIGEYAAVMDGVDLLIFTAGIGENNPLVRKKVLSGMDYMGIDVDWEKNEVKGKELDISAPGSKVKTMVIPTNEELAIARETLKLLK